MKLSNLTYTAPISVYPLLAENRAAAGEAADGTENKRVEMEANKVKSVLGNNLRFSGEISEKGALW